MSHQNLIKLNGRIFDLSNIKGGLLRKDIKDEDLLSIFDNINQVQLGFREETDGSWTSDYFKDNVIDDTELTSFFENLIELTGNNSQVSKSDIRRLGAIYGLDNINKDILFKFLSLLEENSGKIETCKSEYGRTVIEYKNGTVLDISSNKEKLYKKIPIIKDDNMKRTLDLDVNYNFMSDTDTVYHEVKPPRSQILYNYSKIESLDENNVDERILDYIDELIDNINFDNTLIRDQNLLEKARRIVINKLESCRNSTDYKSVLSVLKEVCAIQTKTSRFYQCIIEDMPNCEIDTVAYQGSTGNCWLLSTLMAIGELGDAGKEYIKEHLSFDENTQMYTVKLNGGKSKYTFSLDELKQNSDNLSYGEIDLIALEYGIQKYVKDNGKKGDYFDFNKSQKDLNGGFADEVFEILDGYTTGCTFDYERMQVWDNGDIIPLDIQNIDKLRRKPIRLRIENIKILEVLDKLKCFNGKIAIMCSSQKKESAHQFWIHNISDNKVQIKESHNSGQYAEYSIDDFLKNYGCTEIWLFIP